MWAARTCTGCHQACRYGKMTDLHELDWEEAYRIRFKESQEGAARGEYGKRVRATRGRILGLMHQNKREVWNELVEHCPERLYPPPGGDGPLDFDASDADQAAEVAAAQAVAMEYPITRAELEAQLTEVFPSDAEEWEDLLAAEYQAELAYRKQHGRPRTLAAPPELQHLEPTGAPVPAEEEGGFW